MTPKEALNEEMLRFEDALNKCETQSEEMYIKSRIENIKLRIQIERLSQVISQFAISQPMKPIIIEYSDEVIKQSLTELEELKRDVKRYFELSHNPKTNTNPSEMRPYIEWAEELTDLELHILSKVGKEHV